MQNAQNTEIQQRVINLVELYRTKVGKDSEMAKDAISFYNQYEQLNEKEIKDCDAIYQYSDLENPNFEIWKKHLMVNEQLLGYFYKEVAGDEVDEDVLAKLLPDVYDRTIFSEEDEAFLTSHFKEMVNYIILTPCDEGLKWLDMQDGRDAFTIPNEVLEIISNRIKIAEGSNIYYPYAGFAQFVNLFVDCKYIFRDWNFMMELAIYANVVDAEFIMDEEMPTSYDCVVSYLPSIDKNFKRVAHICEAYKKLHSGGKLLLICPTKLLEGDVYPTFGNLLAAEKAIKEIIQLPDVMGRKSSSSSYSVVVAEKNWEGDAVTFVDARFAQKGAYKKNHKMMFDMDAFDAVISNGGFDVTNGLRKIVTVSYSELNEHTLLPQIYVIERPSKDEHAVPLSSICHMVTERIRDVKFDLPLDTPHIWPDDLSSTFKGALDTSKLRIAGVPNNPSDLLPRDLDDIIFEGGSFTKNPIELYRAGLYLNGHEDAVLLMIHDGIKTALYPATGKAAAAGFTMFGQTLIDAFIPNPGVDAMSLLAILNMPIVYRQILAYSTLGFKNHLNDILVPSDKRVVHDEVLRMKREESTTKAMEEKASQMRSDYINEVRMRKHDMGQKVFDLVNTEDLIRYYVENRETEEDSWSQIEEQLNHLRYTIHELSEMLDKFSQEEHFGTPELLDLDVYFNSLQHSKDINGYKLSFQLDRDSLLKIQSFRMGVKDAKTFNDDSVRPLVFIAKNDIYRVVSNILNNAQRHGFVDTDRKDYEVNIRLRFDSEKQMYQIDFRNNGQPLPEGMDKMRYGIKGEKAGQTAGTGIGGNVVKSIVEHYNGNYDVFMEEGWTVVRICLPKHI